MVLVDTSVLINYLKGGNEGKTLLFASLLSNGVPFGISAYTYQEVLQGARDETEFETLREYLETQHICHLPQETGVFEAAARMYFDLRRKGVTPRGAVDVLIALTAIRDNLLLLHDDRDFDAMACVLKDLRTLDNI